MSESKSVHRLVIAFYFRYGQRNATGEKTFEFTHKSFGEYLTARRLVRELAEIHDQRTDNKANNRKGWTTQKALAEWAQLTGNTPIDADLLEFLRHEVALMPDDPLIAVDMDNCEPHAPRPKPVDLLVTLCELASEVIANEMPMQDVKPSLPTFGEMNRQARNAEIALLAAINACAISEKDKVHPATIVWSAKDEQGAWKNPVRSFEWFNRLRGQEAGYQAFFSLLLSGADLRGADLRGANLTSADLRGARNLEYARYFDQAYLAEEHYSLLEKWKQAAEEREDLGKGDTLQIDMKEVTDTLE